MNKLEKINHALDLLANCGVAVLLSISADDVQDCADDNGLTVSKEKAQLIADTIAKDWRGGDEWQKHYDRLAEILSAE